MREHGGPDNRPEKGAHDFPGCDIEMRGGGDRPAASSGHRRDRDGPRRQRETGRPGGRGHIRQSDGGGEDARGCGYRAEIAETGPDALDALEEKSYVAILMDCQVPLLDVAIVSELEQLDAGILTHLTSMYFAEAAEQLAVLDGAVKSGEMLNVSQVAHKLKGSSSTLGATRVAQILDELETAATEGDLSDGAALIARLRRGLDDTRTAFCEAASAARGVA